MTWNFIRTPVTTGILIYILTFFTIAFFHSACAPGGNSDAGKKKIQLYELRRGDLTITVSSTGTLAADGAVEVGTEISGTVGKISVDFNDKVKKGQVLANLKTDLLKASVRDAQASLGRAQAQYGQTQVEYQQTKALYEKGYLSQKEYLAAKTDNDGALASLQSAQAILDRAKTNAGYAIIRSPINGIILERNIEVGQTIAASFSTPTLFVIAKDLTRMKIEALVDETDISRINPNQDVRFSVSAFPDRIFTGKVIQIRRKSTSVQNVVNYTVIVEAPNKEELLLPGMTATIDFIVEQAKNVFLVPNEALTIEPTPEMVRSAFAQKPRIENPAAMGIPPSQTVETAPNKIVQLWCLDNKNNPIVLPVRTGATDETMTIVSGNNSLCERMKVIIGITNSDKTTKKKMRPRGPMPF